MFNRKSNQIKILLEVNEKLNRKILFNKKDDFNDFIAILEHIQQVNNDNLQWKRKQKTINNNIDLAIENYRNKIMEIDIEL